MRDFATPTRPFAAAPLILAKCAHGEPPPQLQRPAPPPAPDASGVSKEVARRDQALLRAFELLDSDRSGGLSRRTPSHGKHHFM